MPIFDHSDYYRVLRKREVLHRGQVRLDIDSDVEDELIYASSSEEDSAPAYINPTRMKYEAQWVIMGGGIKLMMIPPTQRPLLTHYFIIYELLECRSNGKQVLIHPALRKGVPRARNTPHALSPIFQESAPDGLREAGCWMSDPSASPHHSSCMHGVLGKKVRDWNLWSQTSINIKICVAFSVSNFINETETEMRRQSMSPSRSRLASPSRRSGGGGLVREALASVLKGVGARARPEVSMECLSYL